MAETPYPLPRQLRMSQILIGDGRASYGPFSFRVFDIEDISVFSRPVAGGEWTPVAAGVSKASNLPLDYFTVSFPTSITNQTEFIVVGDRLYERSAGLRKGTQLNPDALERELSKIGVTLQELRRDVDRGVIREFGADGVMLEAGIPDGSLLYLVGNRIKAGPLAGVIGEYVDQVAALVVQAQEAEQAAEGFAQQSAYSATVSASAAGQAQNLVNAAQAGYVGFQPGSFYDLGRVTDPFQLFPGDLGRITDL